MTTNRTSHRAEDFDRALAAEPGAHVDPKLAGLVAVAGALAALPQRSAPAFKSALRTRLMAEAAAMAPVPATAPAAPAAPAATGPVGTLSRMLSTPAMQVATGSLATAIAATGVGVGASRSLPGQPLYGVKRAVERLQVGLAGGATAEATALLEHAQTRLDEVRALLDRGTADALRRVEVILADLQSDLREATDKLLAAAGRGSRAAYERLRATAATISGELVGLMAALPAAARADAERALGTLNVARARLAAIPEPGPTPTPTHPVATTPSSTTPTTTPPVVVTTPPVVVTTPPVVVTTPPVVVTTPPITILSTPPVSLPPVVP